jgi:hypothetical protein
LIGSLLYLIQANRPKAPVVMANVPFVSGMMNV